jgi:hypothetical protein
MDPVRTPLDQTLALLDRSERCADINRFLVQVWPQSGRRGQDEECDQRQKAERAVYLKNRRHH